MIIGERLRELREQKKLPQREIENRSGLQRAYLSRVENGHTVPTIDTLEKWAKALEVPIYQILRRPRASQSKRPSPVEAARRNPLGQLRPGCRLSQATPPPAPQDRRSKPQAPSPNGLKTRSPRAKIRRRRKINW